MVPDEGQGGSRGGPRGRVVMMRTPMKGDFEVYYGVA